MRVDVSWAGMGLWMAIIACGETRELELFAKAAPPPPKMPDEMCGSSGKCPADRSICIEDECVECVEDADCSGGKPVCDGRVCVACLADEHCPMDKLCHPEARSCTEACTSTEACPDKQRKVCDPSRGFCVQCLTTADCGDKHVCDTTLNGCVGCTSDVDCGDAGVCDHDRQECAPLPG